MFISQLLKSVWPSVSDTAHRYNQAWISVPHSDKLSGFPIHDLSIPHHSSFLNFYLYNNLFSVLNQVLSIIRDSVIHHFSALVLKSFEKADYRQYSQLFHQRIPLAATVFSQK